MAKTRCNLRLSDVHATADTVGREFKELTDRFGMMCVTRLVPPVVEALEWLEVYVENYQHLHTRLCELQMENDTLVYERDQRKNQEKKNEELTAVIRELQRQVMCLQMETEELFSKNEELSAQLKNHQSKEELIDLEFAPLSPHTPRRVVYISSTLSSSHSPSFTSSSPPTFPISPSSPSPSTTPPPDDSTHITPSHNNHTHLPTSPLPSPKHHHIHPPPCNSTPSAKNNHDPIGESSLDKRRRSRVTGRLSEVEGELKVATQQVRELQQSKEKIVAENKKLKIQLEELKAEVAVKNSHVSKEKSKEVPRYYKEDVMRVLTERNKLKEDLHTMQEELEEVKDALRMANGGTTTNGVAIITSQKNGGFQCSQYTD